MAYEISFENGKYRWVNDSGVISLYNRGELSTEFSGGKAVLALLHRLEEQERRLGAYDNFRGSVRTMSYDMFDAAFDRLDAELYEIKEEFR